MISVYRKQPILKVYPFTTSLGDHITPDSVMGVISSGAQEIKGYITGTTEEAFVVRNLIITDGALVGDVFIDTSLPYAASLSEIIREGHPMKIECSYSGERHLIGDRKIVEVSSIDSAYALMA